MQALISSSVVSSVSLADFSSASSEGSNISRTQEINSSGVGCFRFEGSDVFHDVLMKFEDSQSFKKFLR